jgi:hypothetical protein
LRRRCDDRKSGFRTIAVGRFSSFAARRPMRRLLLWPALLDGEPRSIVAVNRIA